MKASTLRIWRFMAGLTVEQVGAKLNISAESVRRYERGNRPIPATVAQQLGLVYGVRTDQIIDASAKTRQDRKGETE